MSVLQNGIEMFLPGLFYPMRITVKNTDIDFWIDYCLHSNCDRSFLQHQLVSLLPTHIKQPDATSPDKCSGDCQKSVLRTRTFLTGAAGLKESAGNMRLKNSSSNNFWTKLSVTDWCERGGRRQSKDAISLSLCSECVFLWVSVCMCALARRSLYDLLPSGL